MNKASQKIIEASKKDFKNSDMKDMGDTNRVFIPKPDKKRYPTITVKNMKEIEGCSTGDKTTLHAHCNIKALRQEEDGRKVAVLEIKKAAVKKGHNPAKSKLQARFMGFIAGGGIPKNKTSLTPGKAKEFIRGQKLKGLPEVASTTKTTGKPQSIGRKLRKGKSYLKRKKSLVSPAKGKSVRSSITAKLLGAYK